MWVIDDVDIMYEDMCAMSCEKHRKEVFQLKNYYDIMKRKKDVFWMMKAHVMSPIFYDGGNSDQVYKWFSCCQIESIIPLSVNGELVASWKEDILLFDAVSTFTLAKLSKVCCLCDGIANGDNVLEYYGNHFFAKYNDHYEQLENLSYEEAVEFSKSIPLYNETRNTFRVMDPLIINVAFLISYYFFMEISNDPRIALNCYEEVLSNHQSEDEIIERGDDAYKKHLFDKAIRFYTAGLSSNPHNYSLFGNRARTFLRMNDFSKAELDCRAAINLNPDWSEGYFMLSRALVGQRRIHKAHLVAEFGVRNSNPSSLSNFTELGEYSQILRQDCHVCRKPNVPLTKKESYKELPNAKEDFSDVPDLIDSSSSDDDSDSKDEEPCDDHLHELQSNCQRSETENDVNEKPEKNSMSEQILIQKVVEIPPDVKVVESSNVRRKSEASVSAEPRIPKLSDSVMTEDKKVTDFVNNIIDGSLAMVNKVSSNIAKQHFFDALTQTKLNPKICNLSEDELVVLKYAYAVSCCTSGTVEDLTTALAVLKEIIHDHNKIAFPAVHYTVPLCYFKLHQFKEALEYLQNIPNDAISDRNFRTHLWPKTDNAIDETVLTKFQALIEDLKYQCEYPPDSDALCRYANCQTPPIYFSDPDFKGFVSLKCQERCVLQYHLSCWKVIKDSYGKNDKEFVDSRCITPDCGGLIISVEIGDKDGTAKKHFESEELAPKKKLKKSKLEKKFEIKELKKQKRYRTTSFTESQDKTTSDTNKPAEANTEKSSDCGSACNDGSTKLELEFSEKDVTHVRFPTSTPKKQTTEISASSQPFYIIKKDVEDKGSDNKPSKQHKDKKKNKKSTFSIDEFCGGSRNINSFNEYQLRLHRLQESKRVVEETDFPNFVPPLLSTPELNPGQYYLPEQFSPESFKSSQPLDETSDIVLQSVKDFLYERFEHILQEKGTLHINDPIVTQELQDLPPEWQVKILKCGGFKTFMLQNMKFSVVNDQLCFFSEMMELYNGAAPPNINKIDDFHNHPSEESSLQGKGNESVSDRLSKLNPNANEYSPSTSDCSLDRISNIDDSEEIKNKIAGNIQLRGSQTKENSTHSKGDSKYYVESVLSTLKRPLSSFNSSVGAANTTSEKSNKKCADLKSPNGDKIEVLKQEFCDKVQSLFIDLSSEIPSCDVLDILQETLQVKGLLKKPSNHQTVTKLACNFSGSLVKDCGEQAENSQIALISKEVAKRDNELKEANEKNKLVTSEKIEMAGRLKSLETQLVESRDSIARLQNKLSVEVSALEKSLVEKESEKKEELKILRAKISTLEKEVKQWRQNHDIVKEIEKDTRKENVKLQAKVNGCLNKIEELESKCKEYEEKINIQCLTLEKWDNVVEEKGQLILEKTKDAIEAASRARTAEAELLTLRTLFYLQKLGALMKENTDKIQVVEKTLACLGSGIPTSIIRCLNTYMTQMKVHCDELRKSELATRTMVDIILPKIQTGTSTLVEEHFEYPVVSDPPVISDYVTVESLRLIDAVQMHLMSKQPVLTPGMSLPSSTWSKTIAMNGEGASSSQPSYAAATTSSAFQSPSACSLNAIDKTLPRAANMSAKTVRVETSSLGSLVSTTSLSRFSSKSSLNIEAIANEVQAASEEPAWVLDRKGSSEAPVPVLRQPKAEETNGAGVLASFSKRASQPVELGYSMPNEASGGGNTFGAIGTKRPYAVAAAAAATPEDAAAFTAAVEAANAAAAAKATPAPVPNSSHTQSKKKGGYLKILERLRTRHPDINQTDMVSFIQSYREEKEKLTGMSIDSIVNGVSEIIERQMRLKPGLLSASRPPTIVNRPLASMRSDMPRDAARSKAANAAENPWGTADDKSNQNWDGESSDKSCSICLEDMNERNSMKVDCGHRFHRFCIKKWLDTTSNCPACRMHLLLPEDYPALN